MKIKKTFLLISIIALLLSSVPLFSFGSTSIPSSFTLVGTKDLPPISNQGSVNSCASNSITYMLFTNAVSRYINYLNPKSDWNPSSGEYEYIMSPKFTHTYVGFNGDAILSFLKENGCLSWADSRFYSEDNSPFSRCSISFNGVDPDSNKWDCQKDLSQSALQYRLKNYEVLDLNSDESYKKDGKISLTSTKSGLELINKIKTYLNEGNVVACEGYAYSWKYEYISDCGTLGNKNDECLFYSQNREEGHHCVCIVGYDDNIKCRFENTTLKGAFLMANSWGTSYKNDGYVWVMYDALNGFSDYDEINRYYPDRAEAFFKFYFVNWKTDIEVSFPDLFATIELAVQNRDNFSIQLLRKDKANSQITVFEPTVFSNTTRPSYSNSFSFSGEAINEKSDSQIGVFALNYSELIGSIESTKSINDYYWGVRILSSNREKVTYNQALLKNSSLEILASNNETCSIVDSSHDVWFNFECKTVKYTQGEGFDINLPFYTSAPSLLFKVNIHKGYSSDNLKVLYNGVELSQVQSGEYEIEVIDGEEIIVEGVVKTNEPIIDDDDIDDDVDDDTDTDTDTGKDTEKPKNDYSIITIVICVSFIAFLSLGFIIIKSTTNKKR